MTPKTVENKAARYGGTVRKKLCVQPALAVPAVHRPVPAPMIITSCLYTPPRVADTPLTTFFSSSFLESRIFIDQSFTRMT